MNSRSTPCPICHKPASSVDAPFCSHRCRSVDLGRWFSESYATPAEDVDALDAEQLLQMLTEAPPPENH